MTKKAPGAALLSLVATADARCPTIIAKANLAYHHWFRGSPDQVPALFAEFREALRELIGAAIDAERALDGGFAERGNAEDITGTAMPWKAVHIPKSADPTWAIVDGEGAVIIGNLREQTAHAVAKIVNAHDALLRAGRKVRDHLNARIDQAPSSAKPVFDGLAELNHAVIHAESRLA